MPLKLLWGVFLVVSILVFVGLGLVISGRRWGIFMIVIGAALHRMLMMAGWGKFLLIISVNASHTGADSTEASIKASMKRFVAEVIAFVCVAVAIRGTFCTIIQGCSASSLYTDLLVS